jgi:hypothetical protein
VEANPTVEVHFGPMDSFTTILPSYVPGNWGYFAVWFNGANQITRTVVLLASDVANQTERNHLAREEITQMLGLAKDSYRYSNSIFQQNWTTVQEYADIDEALIEMLYRPQLRPGMGYREAVNLLRTMTRRGWTGETAPVQTVADAPAYPLPRVRGQGGTGAGGETGPGGS